MDLYWSYVFNSMWMFLKNAYRYSRKLIIRASVSWSTGYPYLTVLLECITCDRFIRVYYFSMTYSTV